MKSKITLLFLMTAIGSSELLAQSPTEFYPHGYASNPIESAPMNPESAPAAVPEEESQTSSFSDLKAKAAARLPQENKIEPENITDAGPSDQKGVPIRWVGALIASHDRVSLDASVNDLIRSSDKYDLPLGAVTFVGPPGSLKDRVGILEGLAVREAQTSVKSRVPPEFPVESSPTWIIGTQAGEIVIEGAGPLSKYLNARGELIVPSEPAKPDNSQP